MVRGIIATTSRGRRLFIPQKDVRRVRAELAKQGENITASQGGDFSERQLQGLSPLPSRPTSTERQLKQSLQKELRDLPVEQVDIKLEEGRTQQSIARIGDVERARQQSLARQEDLERAKPESIKIIVSWGDIP